MNFKEIYKQVEKTFASVKFAVVIILVFAIYLTIGTFVESYHGTEFANRLIYKSTPFMLVQFFMFLSILMATIVRLPPKKILYGFYMLHTGLILIFIGSVVTYIAGVDGSMFLPPNANNNKIELSDYELKIQFVHDQKEIIFGLPNNAYTTNLGYEYENIKILSYLPFADYQTTWIPAQNSDKTSSGEYQLFNENFGEMLIFSAHPLSSYESNSKLGPLNVHYMPLALFKCFGKESKSNLIVWHIQDQICFTPEERNINPGETTKGNRFIVFEDKKEFIKFFPEFSPIPILDDLKLDENSPYRIFSRKIFEGSPHLFIFGAHIAYFDPNDEKWVTKEGTIGDIHTLPWMGFQLKVIRFDLANYPKKIPSYTKPIQDNGNMVAGKLKAVNVRFSSNPSQDYWISDEAPVEIEVNNKKMIFDLVKKTIQVPFELTLDRFKMDMDPGTNNPASYESFVKLFTGDAQSEVHHIFMNNPLKFKDFTFYQASYFETEQGYGTVLSVNYDPGRWIKYLGSLLLVIGTAWHFYLRRKKTSHTKGTL
jgi:hypothetical protein